MARPSTCAWIRFQTQRLTWFHFFFLLDLQLNAPTRSPGAFQMPSTLDPPQIAQAACSPHRHRAGAPPVGAARVPPTPGVTSAALAETRPCRTVSQPWGRAPLASIILVPLVQSDPPCSPVSQAEEKSRGLRACERGQMLQLHQAGEGAPAVSDPLQGESQLGVFLIQPWATGSSA